MWYPVSIEIKNLLSHEHTLFIFKQGEMLLLRGPNGIGKSTIIEAITLAITGDVYRKVNKDEYIREGQEETYVNFILQNDVIKQSFRIERTIHITDSSIVKLYENGKPKKSLGDKRTLDANAYIFVKLGISKEDFLNYFVIGQGNHNSFFGGTDTKQKEIISRFSNTTNLDNVIAKLEGDIKEIDVDINTIEKESGRKVELLEYLRQEVETLEQDTANEYRVKKEELEKDIKVIKEGVVNIKTFKVAQLVVDINKLNKQLANGGKITRESIKKVEIQIEAIKEQRHEVQDDLTNWETIKSKLEVRNGKIIACPKCKFEFIPDSKVSVKETKEYLNQAKTEIETIKVKANTLHSQLKIEQAKCDFLEQDFQSYRRLQLTLQEKESSLAIQQEKIDLKQKLLKDKLDELKELKQPTYQKEIKKKQSEIQVLTDDIKTLEQRRVDLLRKKEELMFHQFHFGRKGFKTFLANKSIKNLQDISNYYLNKFQINLQVSISGFKINKSGDIRDKIEVSIVKNGRRRGSFHKFSGGEKSRVDLTGIIAVHKLINNSCETGGLDLLCLDENISYLDTQGQAEIIEILNKAGITSVLVMHMHTELMFASSGVKLEKISEITKLIA